MLVPDFRNTKLGRMCLMTKGKLLYQQTPSRNSEQETQITISKPQEENRHRKHSQS